MKQNQYEITYLIDPRTTEEARAAIVTAVDERIGALEGSVVHASEALRKKLAYAIDHQDSAFMRIMNVEIAAANIHELQDFMKRTNEILRTTILATPVRTRMSQEILDKYGKKKGKKGAGKFDKHAEAKKSDSAKEVSMKDVEKGIEDALTEEVK